MLKKFVSNALLSVVMDKSARKKLADLKGASSPAPPISPGESKKSKKTKKPVRPSSPGPSSPGPSSNESDEQILSTITDALAEARAEATGTPPSSARKKTEKRLEPTGAKTPPKSKDKGKASPEREALLKQAISVHRQKQKVLDDLPAEARDKLMYMAMYAMDPASLPPEARQIVADELEAEAKAAGAPVDDIGSAAKPKRRKRK